MIESLKGTSDAAILGGGSIALSPIKQFGVFPVSYTELYSRMMSGNVYKSVTYVVVDNDETKDSHDLFDFNGSVAVKSNGAVCIPGRLTLNRVTIDPTLEFKNASDNARDMLYASCAANPFVFSEANESDSTFFSGFETVDGVSIKRFSRIDASIEVYGKSTFTATSEMKSIASDTNRFGALFKRNGISDEYVCEYDSGDFHIVITGEYDTVNNKKVYSAQFKVDDSATTSSYISIHGFLDNLFILPDDTVFYNDKILTRKDVPTHSRHINENPWNMEEGVTGMGLIDACLLDHATIMKFPQTGSAFSIYVRNNDSMPINTLADCTGMSMSSEGTWTVAPTAVGSGLIGGVFESTSAVILSLTYGNADTKALVIYNENGSVASPMYACHGHANNAISSTNGPAYCMRFAGTTIPPHAFTGNSLTGGVIVAPNATNLYEYAFHSSAVEALIAPSLTTLSKSSNALNQGYQFYGSYIREVYAPFLTSIDPHMFEGSRIEVADFPRATSIGANAFADCVSLHQTNLVALTGTIPTTAFKNCTALESLDCSLITTIETNAFENVGVDYAVPTTDLVFNYVTTVKANAFKGSKLAYLYLDNVTSTVATAVTNAQIVNFNYGTFSWSTTTTAYFSGATIGTLSLSTNGLRKGIFTGSTISNLNISDNNGTLAIGYSGDTGKCVFDCSPVSVNLGSVTAISNTYACAGIESLASFSLSTAKNLSSANGNYMCANNPNLTTATLTVEDNSVAVTFPAYMFKNCTSLGTLTINSSNKSTYGTVTLGSNFAEGDTELEWLDIDYSLRLAIGNNAFDGCTSLISISEAYIKSIGNYAFRGCVGLSYSYSLQECTSIGQYAFSGCVTLQSITVGGSDVGALTIGQRAFEECLDLGGVYLLSSVSCTINAYAFSVSHNVPGYYQYLDVSIEAPKVTINANAFAGSKLNSVELSEDAATISIASGAFTNSGIQLLKIPGKTKAQIKALTNYNNWGLTSGETMIWSSDDYFAFGE